MMISIKKMFRIKMMMLNMMANRVKIVKHFIISVDSVSNRKRGRKLGQKKGIDVKKGKDMYTKENKCNTRGGTRVRNKEDTEDSN